MHIQELIGILILRQCKGKSGEEWVLKTINEKRAAFAEKDRIDEKIRRKEDMVSYEKLFKLKYDNNGYLQSYKRNENAIKKEIDKGEAT